MSTKSEKVESQANTQKEKRSVGRPRTANPAQNARNRVVAMLTDQERSKLNLTPGDNDSQRVRFLIDWVNPR